MNFSAYWLEYGFFILGGMLLLVALAHTVTAWRYGARMPLTAITSAIFITGIVFIVGWTWSALAQVDWTSTFTITSPLNFIHLSF